MNETWKDIIGYEGCYQISSVGRIRSVSRITCHGHHINGKIMRLSLHPCGYLQIGLCKNGKKTRHYVHRLVLEAFCGSPPRGMESNHKDGDKTNNKVDNLEYCTRSENHKHAYDILGKTAPRGERHGMAKLTVDEVIEIRRLYATGDHTHATLANIYDVCQSAIQHIIDRTHWSHVP